MLKRYIIVLSIFIFLYFFLSVPVLYSDDSGTGKNETIETTRKKGILLSCVLDAGIIMNYSIADIGLNALFRFYFNPFKNPRAFTLGCAAGIIYEHSSSNTYTLYSFPLLFILKKPFVISPVEIFMEIALGPAFNYELMPVSYSSFTIAGEAGAGCTYMISDSFRAGLIFKIYINNIIEIIPRPFLGIRGSFVF